MRGPAVARARGADRLAWFSRSRLDDRLPIPLVRPAHILDSLADAEWLLMFGILVVTVDQLVRLVA